MSVIRHPDAGYDIAKETAKEYGLDLSIRIKNSQLLVMNGFLILNSTFIICICQFQYFIASALIIFIRRNFNFRSLTINTAI